LGCVLIGIFSKLCPNIIAIFLLNQWFFLNYNPIWDSISRPIDVTLKPMVLILHT
jgi:hypothetical protein